MAGAVSAADNSSNGSPNLSVDQAADNSSTNSSQTLPDPTLYDHDGNFIHSYTSIEDAYNNAEIGTSTQLYTIELEDGKTFDLQDFVIQKNLIFTVANGGTATINGLNNRLIHIYPGFTVYFYNIIFQNGHAPNGTWLSPDGSNGGAIWNQGTLYLNNCVLRNNQAGDGGSWDYGGIGGSGGAIWNQGTLNMADCTLYNNRAGHGTVGVDILHANGFDGGNGGAIYSTGTLNIDGCELYNNHAGNGGNGVTLGVGGNGGSGGAIYSTNNMVITETQIHNNYAGNAGVGGSKWIIGGTGGSGGNGGGIYNSGTATITDSQINYNIAGNGGRGASGSDGSELLIHYNGYDGLTGGSGGSGGAIYNTGHLLITTTAIANNNAGNGGMGGQGGDAIKGLTPNTGGNGGNGGQGGHAGGIFNSNYLMITESTVTINRSGNGGTGGTGGKGSDRWSLWPITVNSGNGGNGGAGGSSGSGAGIYHSGSQLEVIGNNLTNNIIGTAGNGGTKGSKGSGNGGHDGNEGSVGSNGFGGAVYALTSSQSLHFNRILGNTSPDIVAADGVSLDAENNWWGSNTEPNTRVSGDVDYSPWIMLRIFANPGSIHYLSTSQITSDLTWNTIDGVNPYQQPTGGHIPDGVTADFGVQSGPGYVNPTSSTTNSGISHTTYFGNGIGTATIYTQVDNERQTVNVNVEKADSKISVNPSSGVYKGSTTLSATLRNEYDTIIQNADVAFYVNGSWVATGNTGSTGIASVIYSPINLNPAGSPYIIEARFLGNEYYNAITGTNLLTVGKANSVVSVNPSSGVYKGSTGLSATLTDQFGNPIVNESVTFQVGLWSATGTTNNSGYVLVIYGPINLAPDTYDITAEFLGNTYYNGNNGANKLTVGKAYSVVSVNPSSGVYKGSTGLSATLTDQFGNPIVNESVLFQVGSWSATGTTNGLGFVSVTYNPINLNPAGSPYTISAEFIGNNYYYGNINFNDLTVNKANSTLVVVSSSGVYKGNTTLQAVLVDEFGNEIEGADVTFHVGSWSAAGTTNNLGIASVIYGPINLAPGTYDITAEFLGNTYYNGNNGANKLTVNKANSILVVDDASGVYKGNTILKGVLVDQYGDPIVGETVTFTVGSWVGTGITNGSGIATVIYGPINLNPTGSPYTITANFAGNSYYNASNGSNKLTVTKANTSMVVKNVTGNPGQTIKLTATLKDNQNKPLNGYKVYFKVNGVNIGYAYTNTSGIVNRNYLVNLKGGSYKINASFAGNNYYNATSSNGTLKVPQANLYIKSWASKTNPTVGDTISINYLVGNYGPDTAEKTIFKLKIPEGMSFSSFQNNNQPSEGMSNTNQGTVTYNKSTKTITWTIGNVKAGETFFLGINVKVLKAGKYNLKPTLTTITYDPNISIPTLTINAKEGSNNNHGEGTIGMQDTGIPIGTLLLAICAVLAGMIIPKRR